MFDNLNAFVDTGIQGSGVNLIRYTQIAGILWL